MASVILCRWKMIFFNVHTTLNFVSLTSRKPWEKVRWERWKRITNESSYFKNKGSIFVWGIHTQKSDFYWQGNENAKIFKTGIMKTHLQWVYIIFNKCLSVDNICSQYCIEIINCSTTNISNYITNKEFQVKLRLKVD